MNNIDSGRMVLRIERGKGGVDREVPPSEGFGRFGSAAADSESGGHVPRSDAGSAGRGFRICYSIIHVGPQFGNLRRARVPETVIMKITGHRTRSVFARYNITDETDTQEAGRKAEEFLAREHEEVAQITSQARAGKLK